MATNKQRRERRAHAEEERRRREQEQRRRRAIKTAVAVAGAVVLIALGAFAYFWLNEDEPVVVPDAATEAGGVAYPVGQNGNKPAADPVEVVVYEDPNCPHCRDFEEEHGDELQSAADRGEISLEYRQIAFVGDESIAPINAAACVLEAQGAEAFLRIHDAVFAEQPDEDELVDLAADAGADGTGVEKCIDAGTHDGWVDKVTSDARDSGVESTPTVQVDGETVDSDELDDIESLIGGAGP